MKYMHFKLNLENIICPSLSHIHIQVHSSSYSKTLSGQSSLYMFVHVHFTGGYTVLTIKATSNSIIAALL